MSALTILHTNDMHGRLMPDQVTRLRQARADLGAAGLLLDAGDAVSSGNITFRPGGEPMLERMSRAGYDAMATGNREFHVTSLGFRTKVSCAEFPVLCANVRARKAGAAVPTLRNHTFDAVGCIRVGVFGVMAPMVTERMAASAVSAFVFDDPVESARDLCAEMRDQCDVLVCISHCGLGQDRRIAQAAPGIDLIVGGHTHATLPEGEAVGETLIVQAGCHAKLLGRVEVSMDAGRPRMRASLEAL
ncbi:MAG: metallophosphatase [Armatimonadetes bacterium]|nr:metallophosphatase [Armatimonadota bacterium]